MVILTGFADEISPELDVQLDVLASEGISHLELRSVWGKNVLQLTDDEVAQIKKKLDERGFRVSAIGSPIGKISITDSFAEHLIQFERAIQLATYFNTPYIRIFSFYIREGQPEQYRQEVVNRMQQLVDLAAEHKITLLHENEKHIYGDRAERCEDLLRTCESPHLRAAFDPANFIQCSVSPMGEAYPLIEPYIEYIHVKDAIMDTGKVVPAGEGDGQFKELFSALIERNYSGFMSLEPHLRAENAFQGMNKPELFVIAIRALKSLLEECDIQWR